MKVSGGEGGGRVSLAKASGRKNVIRTGLVGHRWRVAGMLLILALGGMVGCESSSTSETNLRVVHLSPDAPALDVFVRGTQQLIQGLSFPNSTTYQNLDSGVATFEISPTGATPADNILQFQDVLLMEDAAYTIVIYDVVAAIAGLMLEDNLSNLPDGNIRLRVMHAAADVGQVDILNILAAGSPSLLYENLNLGEAGGAVELPAGTYTLGIDVTNDGNSEYVFALPRLSAGAVVNMFATTDNGNNVFLLLQFADSSTRRIDPS